MGTQQQLIEKIESTVGWFITDRNDAGVIAINPQNDVKLHVTWKDSSVQYVSVSEPDEFGNVAQFALGADVADKLKHAIDIVEKYDVLNYGTNRG